MKVIISLVIMLFIYTGCVEKKNHLILNGDFCLNNEGDAIKVAEKEWLKIYGNDIYEYKPFMADLRSDSVWVIYGTLPRNHLGGTPQAKINAKTCEIINVIRGK